MANTKLTRKQFVMNMFAKGMTDEEVADALLVGDPEHGIAGTKKPFHRLLLIRIKKRIKYVEPESEEIIEQRTPTDESTSN